MGAMPFPLYGALLTLKTIVLPNFYLEESCKKSIKGDNLEELKNEC